MKTKEEIKSALVAALAVPYVRARASGCGRAYVCVSGLERTELTAFAAAAKELGRIFQRKGHGVSNALYVGYDNADGGALGKAEAIATELSKRGISAYAEGVAD